ncbi:MAG: hypothetical protein ACRD2E_02060 [Terriglobales bacterium]
MIFIASGISSLSRSLGRWEWAVNASEALVTLACVGELIADFGEKWLGEKRRKRLERRSTIVLVAALFASLICVARTNELSGNVIGSLGEIAGVAGTKAQAALDESSAAEIKADGVMAKVNAAEIAADDAQRKASSANALAHGASIEAVSAENALGRVKEDVARVEAKYAPRTLTKTERSVLVQYLAMAPERPGTPIEVDSFIGASDGVSYATEIVDAINEPATGWRARYGAQSTLGGNLKGVVLIVHDLKSAPRWAIYLQRALKAAGLGGDGALNDEQKVGTAMIFIAPKN